MFENIIEALTSNDKKKPFAMKVLHGLIKYSYIFLFVAAIFTPAIKESQEWIKYFIGYSLALIIVILFGYFVVWLWKNFTKCLSYILKNIHKNTKIPNKSNTLNIIYQLLKNIKNNLTFGDPLINRAKLDEKLFINKCSDLVDFEKKDIEKFRDWLEYRIKFEGMIIAALVVFLRLYPVIVKKFDELFKPGALFDSKWMINPFEKFIFPVSVDLIVMLVAILIIGLTTFIPKWFKYLHIAKFAVNHGYHKITEDINNQKNA